MMKVSGLCFCFLLLCNFIFGQQQYPQHYFRSPLNIPLQLSANFGALRKNHFHMGLDIRTQSRENLPVYAAAAGYVSRIKIEKWGYGRAIYITHPNGFTTLYAHLNDFAKPLQDYITAKQYADESWEQDVKLPAGLLKISKGDFIAFSGSTGGSGGPHLHFEIRETKTDKNLNPLLFGFAIADNIAPVIHQLFWYDRRYSTYQVDGKTFAANGLVKVGSPLISLGINADDKTSNSSFTYGIFHAELWMDDSLLNTFTLDNFSYDDTRNINGCIDYTHYVKTGNYVQHLSTLPGNRLEIFSEAGSNGLINLSDAKPHDIKIVVQDANHNTKEINFAIEYDEALKQDYFFTMNSRLLKPLISNTIETDNVKTAFDANAFYDAVPFVTGSQPATQPAQSSETINLHNKFIPLQDSVTVQVKASKQLSAEDKRKTVLQIINSTTSGVYKGSWKGDWFTTKLIALGTIRLITDNTPPVIKTIGWNNGTIFNGAKAMTIRCTDQLDEVAVFRAELDGSWLMFAKKNDDFMYRFDAHCSTGNHVLKITVTDKAGNTTQQQFNFIKR